MKLTKQKHVIKFLWIYSTTRNVGSFGLQLNKSANVHVYAWA